VQGKSDEERALNSCVFVWVMTAAVAKTWAGRHSEVGRGIGTLKSIKGRIRSNKRERGRVKK